MDRRTPYTLSVLAPSTTRADESRTTIQNRLRDFVLEFQLDNAFIYRYTSHIHNRGSVDLELISMLEQGPITTECPRQAILLRYRHCPPDFLQ